MPMCLGVPATSITHIGVRLAVLPLSGRAGENLAAFSPTVNIRSKVGKCPAWYPRLKKAVNKRKLSTGVRGEFPGETAEKAGGAARFGDSHFKTEKCRTTQIGGNVRVSDGCGRA